MKDIAKIHRVMIKTNSIIINTGAVFTSSGALIFFGTAYTEHRGSRSVNSSPAFIGSSIQAHPVFFSGGKMLYFGLSIT